MLTGVGESAFNQDEYEVAMMRFDELGVKLSVVYVTSIVETRYELIREQRNRLPTPESGCG